MAKSLSNIGVICFALALLSRIMLPLGASAQSYDFQAYDPIANAPICTHDGVKHSAPSPADADPHGACDHCAFTCCNSLVGLIDNSGAVFAISGVSTPILWVADLSSPVIARSAQKQRARGPPAFS